MGVNLRKDQTGIVSIVVTIILLGVLSITTLGFAQIARREQRQALDRQLSSQAFYAAEAGINDAAKALQDGTLTTNKTDCGNPSLGQATLNFDFNLTGDPDLAGHVTSSAYTCVLVNLWPQTLEYSSINLEKSTFADITGVDNNGVNQNITRLVISWQDEGGGNGFAAPGATTFPPAANWLNGGTPIDSGVLRVALTSLNGGGAYQRNNLINNTLTAFLYPNSDSTINNAGSLGFVSGPAGQGQIINGHCNTAHTQAARPRYCNVEVTGLNGPHYFLRMKSLYKNSRVTITAYGGATGTTLLRIKGAQALVDSTGKAADVLRRIQVRLPVRADYNYPEYGVETGEDICKLLETEPGSTTNGCTLAPPPGGIVTGGGPPLASCTPPGTYAFSFGVPDPDNPPPYVIDDIYNGNSPGDTQILPPTLAAPLIPRGRYNIRLSSYDFHDPRVESQANERWELVLLASNAIRAISVIGPTDDLLDNQTQNSKMFSNVRINETAYYLLRRHAGPIHDPPDAGGTAESIRPLEARFQCVG